LDLTSLDLGDTPALHAKWVQIYDRISRGEMPPAKSPRPDPALQRTFLTTLGTRLAAQHAAMKGTVLRRLNRVEYQNTLNDLFGLNLDVINLLPEDSLAHGFDNQGEALGMSDVQMQRYLEAAAVVLESLTTHDEKPATEKKRFTYDAPAYTRNFGDGKIGGNWLKRPDGAVVIFGENYPGTALREFKAASDGLYRIQFTAYGYQSDGPVVFALDTGTGVAGGDRANNIITQGFYEVPEDEPTVVEVAHNFRKGESLRIRPQRLGPKPGAKPLHNLPGGPAAYQGSGLAIQSIEIEGPMLDTWPPRGHQLLFGNLPIQTLTGAAAKNKPRRPGRYGPVREVISDAPAQDARRLLPRFASALFRRPVDEAGIAPYLALFDAEIAEGSSFEQAMHVAATALLCSPDFLYLREPAGRLGAPALAARLSYFLTRSTPDSALQEAAASGRLLTPAGLQTVTDDLLRSPRASRFVADFTDGWLDLRNIEFTAPDKQLYPEYDAQLQDSLVRETRAFFTELIQANLPVSTIIQSDFAMLNRRLAAHYGIEGITGTALRKSPLPPGSRRGGLLTQASVLKVSANGTNTSPVMRGVWVMERILGYKPQPPPPGTPGVEPDIRGATTLRELLAKHSNMESCQGCHQHIDPPGFALENYDVIGGWREQFRSLGEGKQAEIRIGTQRVRYKIGPPVDASGDLPGGVKFADFTGFQQWLLEHDDRVTRSLAHHLLTFATGREPGFSDRPTLDHITRQLRASKGGVRDLLHLVVQSDMFLTK
jgi:hypothetical protein